MHGAAAMEIPWHAAFTNQLPALLSPTVGNLAAPANKWTVGGTPLLSMMHLERRSGR